ncbi:hypothetical protein ACR56S_03730 [Staphylococcus hominis]|uniref:hypothetical protein n=1 Tax=Staphylococcus hominis TaxID=1290 RepID=UPI003DA0AA69
MKRIDNDLIVETERRLNKYFVLGRRNSLGQTLRNKAAQEYDELIKDIALKKGFPRDVEIERLDYNVEVKPNISVGTQAHLIIALYNIQSVQDLDEQGFTEENATIKFFSENLQYIDSDVTIQSTISEYNELDNQAIDEVKKTFNFNVDDINDFALLKAIDDEIERTNFDRFLPSTQFIPIFDYLKQNDMLSDIDEVDIEHLLKIKVEEKLVYPTDTSEVERLAYRLIDEKGLTTLEQVNTHLFGYDELNDAIIQNSLFINLYGDRDATKFSIEYKFDEDEVIKALERSNAQKYNYSMFEIG